MSTELMKAVERATPMCGKDTPGWVEIDEADWDTILAALRDLEAENARLKDAVAKWEGKHSLALIRSASDEALLRESYDWLFESKSDGPRVSEGAIEKHYYSPELEAFHARIQSNLQGAGDEAV